MLFQPNSGLMVEQAVEDDGQVARFVLIWQQIQQHLETEKVRIVEEIGEYPHPIPACDAQFNGLLEERSAILGEYWQVKGFLKKSHSASEHVEYLNAFLLSSHYLGSELILELQALLVRAGTVR